MEEQEDEPSWQRTLLSRRHITHNRSKSSRSSGKNSGQIFDPKNSYGVYEITCPALSRQILKTKGGLKTVDLDAEIGPASAGLSPSLSAGGWTSSPGGLQVQSQSQGGQSGKKNKGGKGANSRRGSKEDRHAQSAGKGMITEATFEIHSLVPGDGNEGALQATFNFSGLLHGVAILAGSRRLLSRVIADLEGEDSPDEDELEAASVASTAAYDDSDEEQEEIIDEIEQADERERRKLAAFEKNSFRAPKFWFRWRGWVSSDVAGAGEGDGGSELLRSKSGRVVEVNTGYIVFSGNDCARLNGTFNCAALGWKNVKISGAKVIRKGRASPLEWSEVVADSGDGGGNGSRRR